MSEPSRKAVPEKLGTFLGVYTPSILTILGVILFLRTGWVVGSVGLAPALAIVCLAHAITITTALSVSAVATNMPVKAGGAYYMISRSLGLEIGGAIGIPLFLAQTFSVTLYAFGLAESLQLLWPELPLRPAAAATVLLVAALAGRGARLALRLQLPIMAAIGLALLSLFTGSIGHASSTLILWRGGSAQVPFWEVFAIFFPAVTGIMAGISLSGDLRDPKRSLPAGTLLAVATGFAIYVSVLVALAVSAEPSRLLSDPLIWLRVSSWPLFVYPALWGAIFSSAVGSILGAPRTFEALLSDRVLPGLPRRILGLSLSQATSVVVALAAVGLGNLNAVAPVLTMFFLTTYGTVNLVAGIERLSGSPAYRPTIRVPGLLSLAGAAGCLWVMWLIHPLAALLAVALELLIYLALRRRSLNAAWGDARYGALMSLARSTLLALRRLPVDPRNWRPHILVFAGDLCKRLDLVRFAAWLNQQRGILTVCKLLVGELEHLSDRVPSETEQINRRLEQEGLVAFAEVNVAAGFESGVLEISQANGIAGISSNTLMLGWTEKPERQAGLLRIVRRAALLNKSTLLCRVAPRSWAARPRRIDVWWGGLQNNGDMLLLFAHLISQNPEWSSARIHVKSIASSALSFQQTQRTLEQLLGRSRIAALPQVLQLRGEETVREVIHRESGDADLVFLGLQSPPPGTEEAYAGRIVRLIGKLPTVILVRAAGPFSGQLLDQVSQGEAEPSHLSRTETVSEEPRQ